ncbi:MAG: hypothetical protein LBV00_13390 [Propionibacteriaceae bacterium]|jgi:hypothetical protein|nr:hypothetical protein [Propionibacteriaceae bacterium]
MKQRKRFYAFILLVMCVGMAGISHSSSSFADPTEEDDSIVTLASDPELKLQRFRTESWHTGGATDSLQATDITDGSTATWWHSNWGVGSGSTAAGPYYIDLDYGTVKDISQIELDKRAGGTGYQIFEVRVFIHGDTGATWPNGQSVTDYFAANADKTAIASDFDDAGWEEVTGLSPVGLGGSGTTQTVSIPLTDVKSRYVRLEVTCVNPPAETPTFTVVSEIRAFGTGPAYTAGLESALSAAQAVQVDIVKSEDGCDVASGVKWATTAEFKALTDAQAAANAVLATPDVPQSEIDAATAALVKATTDFDNAVNDVLKLIRYRTESWYSAGADKTEPGDLDDGQTTTYWHSNFSTGTSGSGGTAAGPHLVDLDFGELMSITQIELDKRSGRTPQQISNVRVWVHPEVGDLWPNGQKVDNYFIAGVAQSDIEEDFKPDGWVEVEDPPTVGLGGSSQTQTVAIDLAGVESRYVRLEVTCVDPPNNTLAVVAVSEIRAFGVKAADRSVLKTALDAAAAAPTGVVVAENGLNVDPAKQWVTQAELDALNAAKEEAECAYGTDGLCQTDVADAAAKLQAAITTFNNAKEAGTKPSKTALESALSAAQAAQVDVAKSEDGCDVASGVKWATAAEFKALADAQAAANAVLTSTEVTQAEVDAATAALAKATVDFNKAVNNEMPLDRFRTQSWYTAAGGDKTDPGDLTDGSTTTYWHSNYGSGSNGSGSPVKQPYFIDLDYGELMDITQIELDKRSGREHQQISEVLMWIHPDVGDTWPNGEAVNQNGGYFATGVPQAAINSDFGMEGWIPVSFSSSGLGGTGTTQTVTISLTDIQARYVRLQVKCIVNPALNQMDAEAVAVSEIRAFGTKAVDKTALAGAITTATSAPTGVKVSTDGTDVDPWNTWVTQAELDALNAAKEAAQCVLDADGVCQVDVDQATKDLQDAITTFEKAKKDGLKPVVIPVPAGVGPGSAEAASLTPLVGFAGTILLLLVLMRRRSWVK